MKNAFDEFAAIIREEVNREKLMQLAITAVTTAAKQKLRDIRGELDVETFARCAACYSTAIHGEHEVLAVEAGKCSGLTFQTVTGILSQHVRCSALPQRSKDKLHKLMLDVRRRSKEIPHA